MSSKLGIAAAVVIAIWFVWIAIDLRQNDGADDDRRNPPRNQVARRDNRPSSRPGRGDERRAIKRSANQPPRENFAPERRAPIPAQERGSDRDDGSAQPHDTEARDPAALQQMQEAALGEAGQAAAPGRKGKKSTKGSARGDKKASQENAVGDAVGDAAKKRFKPSASDLKPDADLAGADLKQAQLDGMDLEGIDLTDADLHKANMTDAILNDGILANANLTGATVKSSDLVNVDMHGARLDSADFRGAGLSGANLTGVSATKGMFSGVTFQGANLTGTDFQEAHLFGTDFRDTIMDDTNFKDADLREANFTGGDLNNVQNLTCGQLKTTRGWQTASRPEDLACGAPIPGSKN